MTERTQPPVTAQARALLHELQGAGHHVETDGDQLIVWPRRDGTPLTPDRTHRIDAQVNELIDAKLAQYPRDPDTHAPFCPLFPRAVIHAESLREVGLAALMTIARCQDWGRARRIAAAERMARVPVYALAAEVQALKIEAMTANAIHKASSDRASPKSTLTVRRPQGKRRARP